MLTRLRILADMKEIGLRELRPQLSSTIKTVEAGSPVVVTRQGRPAAVIVQAEEYQRLVDVDRETSTCRS
jgi:prevent-host-death family protein